MHSIIGLNIKYLRSKAGLSQSAFGELFTVSRDNIASYERGGEPKIELIQKIVKHFHIELSDFITKDISEVNSNVEEPAAVYKLENQGQSIPLYDIEAAAGLVQLFQKPHNIIDYITIPNMPKCDGAVRITGDSMYPLLKSGDIVMYKVTQDIPNSIFWGEMYLISIATDDDEMITVKYVQKSELKEHIKLVSYNEHHQPKDIPVKNIRALALVKASIRINNMS